MTVDWDEPRLLSLIANGVEESLTLEYKGAQALGKSRGKKVELTKDVSAMANSAGGDVIYGVKEFDDPDRSHLPEAIDPVDRSEFSKEWLEHVIGNIQPRIDGLTITPVSLTSATNHVVYVVSLPQSTTAHQCQDLRYYKRLNFESVPMQDYEVRDVMNRAKYPEVDVEFSYQRTTEGETHHYRLGVQVRNRGQTAVEAYKLWFGFPLFGPNFKFRKISNVNHPYFGLITIREHANLELAVTFRSKDKLFPDDSFDVGEQLGISYWIDSPAYQEIRRITRERGMSLAWRLFADNMPPKEDHIPFDDLHEY